MCLVQEPLCVTHRCDGTTTAATRRGSGSVMRVSALLASGQDSRRVGGNAAALQPPPWQAVHPFRHQTDYMSLRLLFRNPPLRT